MIQTLCLIPFLFNIKQSHARIGTANLLSTTLPCYQLSCTVGYIFFLCYFKNAQQLYWDSIQAIKKVNQFCGATKQLINATMYRLYCVSLSLSQTIPIQI